MRSVIRLFKAVPIKASGTPADREILKETIKEGFIFSDDVLANYSKVELDKLIVEVKDEISLSGKDANSSFHKSWNKIKTATTEQLVVEQLLHYFTTYGLESLGMYNENYIYIPFEKLSIPKLNAEKTPLLVIKGYTKEQLKDKVLHILHSGIALSEQTMKDVLDVSFFVGIKEIGQIKNKEVKAAFCDYLNIVPKEPVEFLRYIIYKATDKTLIIKNEATIAAIKSKENLDVLGLLEKYEKEYGLERLSEIFYRFKPLFLAFKKNTALKAKINKLRKLAVKHHKPMPEDYLNGVTKDIQHGNGVDVDILRPKLQQANIFRKIRLAYALNFRAQTARSILYKVRNGSGYAKEFSFLHPQKAEETLSVVLEEIAKDISTFVNGKKIYIPPNIFYALPATEKQFSGAFPSGTYVKVPKDMVFGVNWKNVKGLYENRIDLDLALLTDEGKYGWDSSYRDDGRTVLFSGDMTDASGPNGSTELFYVKAQPSKSFLLTLNYFNHEDGDGTVVPIKIFVAQEEAKNMRKNYIVNPNNILAVANSQIKEKQRVIGLVTQDEDGGRFYFSEANMGRDISSSNSVYSENSRKYFVDFYKNPISMAEILKTAGAQMVDKPEEADINLSPESLEKDTILKLLIG